MIYCHTRHSWIITLFVLEDDWSIHECQMQLKILFFYMQKPYFFAFNLWSKTHIINDSASHRICTTLLARKRNKFGPQKSFRHNRTLVSCAAAFKEKIWTLSWLIYLHSASMTPKLIHIRSRMLDLTASANSNLLKKIPQKKSIYVPAIVQQSLQRTWKLPIIWKMKLLDSR